jgi:hypothetical protein
MLRTTLAAGLVSLILCGVSFAAPSNELIIQDQANAKAAGRIFSLDYISDGTAVGLQIRVKVEGLSKGGLDVSNCLADLPKSHIGSCKVTDAGDVLVLVYSATNAPLPQGMVSIGKVIAKGKSQGKLVVSEFLVADKNANPISATSVIQ